MTRKEANVGTRKKTLDQLDKEVDRLDKLVTIEKLKTELKAAKKKTRRTKR
jgi:hypothetical protein